MSNTIEARLAELGHTLPEAAAPAANYLPWVLADDMLYVSGQVAMKDGALLTGKLGADMDLPAGVAAAECCALSLLAHVKAATGSLAHVRQVVKLTGFVNSTPEFTDQPKVINGASDLLVELLGDAGRHARSAVGVASLPMGVAVEIEGIFRVA